MRPLRHALWPVLAVIAAAWWAHPKGADTPLPSVELAPLLRAGPPAPIEIAVLGTSLTAGSTWPEAVAGRLAECSGAPVRLTRFALGGATSAWGLDQIPALAAEAPDIVLAEFTINDADLRRGIGRAESARLHREIVARLAAAAPQTRVLLLRLNRAHGLRALLRPRLASYEAQLPALARETGAGFLDLRPAWAAALAEAQEPRRLLPDGLHPADAAARRIVAPPVARALCAALGGTAS